MTVFPEINSLEDYENIPNFPKKITRESIDAITTKHRVSKLDIYGGESSDGILSYNSYVLQLNLDNGYSECSPYIKFRYPTLSNIDSRNLTVLVRESVKYSFSNKEDFDTFCNFFELLDKRTEHFIDLAIAKTCNYYSQNKNDYSVNAILDEMLKNFPEKYFIDDNYYFYVIHWFTSCDITRKYVKFSYNETNNAYRMYNSDLSFRSHASSIIDFLRTMRARIRDHIKFNNDYFYLYHFLALKNKLIEKYSSIWEKEYDNTYDPNESINFITYVEYCAKECRITKNDNRSIFSLACFWLKHLKNQNDDIRDIVKRIKSITILKDCATIQNITYKSNTINNNSNDVKLTTSYEKLNKLIGLSAIKNDVNNMINLVKMQIKRKNQGLKAVPVSLHLVFTGNPGTGKTTIARILADIYKEIGVLSKGHLVEVDRSGLVAGYVGQTAIKTQEKINEALGGILFIDEAYTLVKEGQDFGQEAIDTILKAMEDHRDDFIVIVAGYTDLMQNFINSNPGLKSRFNKYIEFPDYSAEELVQIFYSMCNEYQYTLTSEADTKLKEIIFNMEKNKDDNFANARDVRNLFEMVITKQATRLSESNGNIMEIDACDFQ